MIERQMLNSSPSLRSWSKNGWNSFSLISGGMPQPRSTAANLQLLVFMIEFDRQAAPFGRHITHGLDADMKRFSRTCSSITRSAIDFSRYLAYDPDMQELRRGLDEADASSMISARSQGTPSAHSCARSHVRGEQSGLYKSQIVQSFFEERCQYFVFFHKKSGFRKYCELHYYNIMLQNYEIYTKHAIISNKATLRQNMIHDNR